MRNVNTHGKVALVTGATSGIGKIAALQLALGGAEVVIVGRDPKRTAETVTELSAKAPGAKVSAILGDLSRVAEVRRVAREFRDHHSQLHILINNAGALFHDREVTAEGFERTFALNHLAYFVLTTELLDVLRGSAPARVVSVASEAHRSGKLDFDDLQSEKRYTRFGAYGTSKLANILFTRELARRLAGSGVTANCVHPGVVATNFGSGTGFIAKMIQLAQPLMLTPEQGADTLVHLATSPEVEGMSGLYWSKRKPRTPTSAARNDEVAARLWSETERLVARV